MRKMILLMMFFGCTVKLNAQTTVVDSLFYGGVWHHYRVYLPLAHSCSLIMHLHGYGSSGAVEQSFTNYMPIADTAGFVVAYPDGLADGSGNLYWNIGWTFPNTNDVAYLSVFIDTLIKRYAIDPSKVFASGFSVGGFMCHKLACELSNKIAAIADVSGSMTMPEYTSCAPTRAVPVMLIHGTSDNTVPYTGSSNPSSSSVHIDTLIKFCANLDQCNPVPIHTVLPHNVNTTNGTTVDRYVYTGGSAGATCELYKINNGSHVEWPGQSGNNDFNASASIWNFFHSYRSGACVLPVRINSFTARSGNENILLLWQTEREVNNKYFEVQHSANGINFETIAFVPMHGNIGTTQQYFFTDDHPLPGVNYYRLKEIDEDGRYVFSNIIIVHWEKTQVILYPNPASSIVYITLPLSMHSIITLNNIQGKFLKEIRVIGNISTIDISSLLPGLYIVKVQQNDVTYMWKLMKL